MQIMKLVNGYFVRTRKSWTLMSQKWMMKSLKNFYGVKVPRSTLNYNLKILRKQGLIETVTRHCRDKVSGEFTPQVTLYKATSELKKFFSKFATYFKRCGWLPDIKAVQAGAIPVVGAATTKESCLVEIKKQANEDKRKDHDKPSSPETASSFFAQWGD